MNQFIYTLLKQLNSNLQAIELEETTVISKAQNSILCVKITLSKLKNFILHYTFKNEVEEILFFKEIKPGILSKLIYYMSVYKIEISRPNGSCFTLETYLLAELDRLKYFFDRNIEFYHYYRTGCTHFDKIYFLRNRDFETPINFDCFYFERDARFSTNFDYKIAKIMANDLLELYLKSQLVKLKENPEKGQEVHTILKTRETWTASKTDLVELIYALDTAKCINNGNINLKALASYFENVFNICIGDIYHIYLEIRERKGSHSQFLDRLKDKLTERIDEANGDTDN